MTRSPLRTLFALSFMLGTPALLLGCPKKKEPVVEDSAPPPPPPTPATTASSNDLVPLDSTPDAGFDAGVDAGPAHHGAGLTASQSHVKQCCNALRAQAKSMGNSPESSQLQALAATCDQFAMQVGPSKGAQAPELEPLRQILKGKPTIPALCSGL